MIIIVINDFVTLKIVRISDSLEKILKMSQL